MVNKRGQRWRWAVPGVVVAAAALVIGVRPVLADASPTLPPRTAAQLLAELPSAASRDFSGTVTTTARLGLPDLPGSVQGAHAPVSIMSLLTGKHTLRVWHDGPERQRVALVGDLTEADVIHNGQDVWAWNSDTRSGVHLRLPDHDATHAPTPSSPEALPQDLMRDLTPQRLAEKLLAAVDPTTKVTVDGTATVAGRDAYELVVAPRDHRSLVDEIRLAVDARTSLPLRLRVFSTRSADPAIESGFTSISYDTPSASVFRAPDVPLTELTVPSHAKPTIPSPAPSDLPRVHGSGWTSVLELPSMPDLASLTGAPGVAPLRTRPQGKGDTDGTRRPDIPPPDDSIAPAGPLDDSSTSPEGSSDEGPAQLDGVLQALLRSATPVSGAYGSGRMLKTALVSVLMLDDGRVFVGAVTPSLLEQVADHAAVESSAPSSSAS
jgi:hypothetical protein